MIEDLKLQALVQFLNLDEDSFTEEDYAITPYGSFEIDGDEYKVLDEEELLEEIRENIIDSLDEKLYNIPDWVKDYFDEEKYIQETIKNNSYEDWIYSCDGNLYEVCVESDDKPQIFYIYKV